MKLNETPIEKDFRVADVREDEKILRRLEALGILEGTRVRVLNRNEMEPPLSRCGEAAGLLETILPRG